MLLKHGADAKAKNNVSTAPPSSPLYPTGCCSPLPVAFAPVPPLCDTLPSRARPFSPRWLLFFFPAIPLLPPFCVRVLPVLPAPRSIPLYLEPASLFRRRDFILDATPSLAIALLPPSHSSGFQWPFLLCDPSTLDAQPPQKTKGKKKPRASCF